MGQGLAIYAKEPSACVAKPTRSAGRRRFQEDLQGKTVRSGFPSKDIQLTQMYQGGRFG